MSGQTALRFIVHGAPATKGSLKPVKLGKGNQGRIALIESHTTSKPWREAVKWAALEAIASHEGTGSPFATLGGPVEVDVIFTFAKPKSAPKTRRIWPITRSSGDVDKLARNMLDAFVDAALMGDDSQVIRLICEKAFVDDPGALPHPGARVIVRPLPAAVREEQLAAALDQHAATHPGRTAP